MDNWRTSSYSSGDGGQCVEIASGDAIMVRDTTDRRGPVLTFAADAWRTFLASVRQAWQYTNPAKVALAACGMWILAGEDAA